MASKSEGARVPDFVTDLSELFKGMSADDLLKFSEIGPQENEKYKIQLPDINRLNIATARDVIMPYMQTTGGGPVRASIDPVRASSDPVPPPVKPDLLKHYQHLLSLVIVNMHELNEACSGISVFFVDSTSRPVVYFRGVMRLIITHWRRLCLAYDQIKQLNITGPVSLEDVPVHLTYKGAFIDSRFPIGAETVRKLNECITANSAVMGVSTHDFIIFISKIKDWSYGKVDTIAVVYDAIKSSLRYVEAGRPEKYYFKLELVWKQFERMCTLRLYTPAELSGYLVQFMAIQTTVLYVLTFKAEKCGALKPVDVLTMLQACPLRPSAGLLHPIENVYRYVSRDTLIAGGLIH